MGGVILIGSIIIWALSSFPKIISYSVDFIVAHSLSKDKRDSYQFDFMVFLFKLVLLVNLI